MSDFKCPYPDCPRDDFKSQNAVSVHHVQKHGESLAKKETNCKNCDNGFNYYPSQKEGILCDSCIDDESVDIFDFRDSGGNIDTDYIERECPNCETINTVTEYEAEENDRTFCGEDCYDEYRRENSLVGTNCGECSYDMTIRRKRYEEAENNFCSPKCHRDFIRRERITIECENCGENKERPKNQVKNTENNFCSPKCHRDSMGDGGKICIECDYCEDEFDKWRSDVLRNEHHFCDKICEYKYRGKEDFNHDAYGAGFCEMKRKVRERDNYKCQICGKDKEELGRNPSVHHITPVKWFISNDGFEKHNANYAENGVLLCGHHHAKVEYGKIELEEHIDDELAKELELENPVEKDN